MIACFRAITVLGHRPYTCNCIIDKSDGQVGGPTTASTVSVYGLIRCGFQAADGQRYGSATSCQALRSWVIAVIFSLLSATLERQSVDAEVRDVPTGRQCLPGALFQLKILLAGIFVRHGGSLGPPFFSTDYQLNRSCRDPALTLACMSQSRR